jgi:hypothetical protein
LSSKKKIQLEERAVVGIVITLSTANEEDVIRLINKQLFGVLKTQSKIFYSL